MTALHRALRAEVRKVIASRVPSIAAAALVGGVLAITSAMTLELAETSTLGGAKLDAFAVTDADSFVASAAQVALVASLLAFGVVGAWIFGREFADGTITGLFARPVSLAAVAAAKLCLHLVWCLLVIVLLMTGSVAAIMALGYGWPEAETWAAVGRLGAALVITALLSTAAALLGSLALGILFGLATIVRWRRLRIATTS